MMRSIRLTLLLLSAALLLILAAACASSATPAPTAEPPTPTALSLPTAVAPAASTPTAAAASAGATSSSGEVTGSSLFELSCGSCHGQDRAGQKFTLDSQSISVPALAWADLNTTFQTDPSRGTAAQQLGLAITKGLDEKGADLNAMMPRWSSFSQAQVDSLIQYLQNAGTASGGATLSSAAMDLKGEQLYQAACASCHGQDRAGQKFTLDSQSISVPALAWADLSTTFQTDPSRGTAAQQVGLAITKGLDEKGADLNAMMPRWSFLTQAQVDSLIQYLQGQ